MPDKLKSKIGDKVGADAVDPAVDSRAGDADAGPEEDPEEAVEEAREHSIIFVFITLEEGTKIEYHPEKSYPDWLFSKFSRNEKTMLQNDRKNGTITPKQYNGNGGRGQGNGRGGGRGYGGRGNGGYNNSNKRRIEQLEQTIDDMQSQRVPDQVDTQRSGISQVTTTGGSIMGGRADQSRQYGGRGGGRGWS